MLVWSCYAGILFEAQLTPSILHQTKRSHTKSIHIKMYLSLTNIWMSPFSEFPNFPAPRTWSLWIIGFYKATTDPTGCFSCCWWQACGTGPSEVRDLKNRWNETILRGIPANTCCPCTVFSEKTILPDQACTIAPDPLCSVRGSQPFSIHQPLSKMNILSSFTHLHVIPNYDFLFLFFFLEKVGYSFGHHHWVYFFLYPLLCSTVEGVHKFESTFFMSTILIFGKTILLILARLRPV